MGVKCCFYDCNETIRHLFFDCQHTKIIWRTIHIAIGLTPSKPIPYMLENWLIVIGNSERKLIICSHSFSGLFDVHRMILFLKGTICFFYVGYIQGSILVVILGFVTAWDAKEIIRLADQALEVVALNIFVKNTENQ